MSTKTIVYPLPGTLIPCIHMYSVLSIHTRLILHAPAPPLAISIVAVCLKQLGEIQLTGIVKESSINLRLDNIPILRSDFHFKIIFTFFYTHYSGENL